MKLGKPNVTTKIVAKTAQTTGRVIVELFWAVMKTIGTIILIGILTGVMFGCMFAVFVKTSLTSDLDIDLEDFTRAESSVIYYFDKNTQQYEELETLYNLENSFFVPYDDIPQNLIDAAVAIEDKRFWEHHGVDWYRTTGAVGSMFLTMSDTYGGSTITQQLIKNLTTDDEVTVKRKLTEIFRALNFEKRYSKEEILEGYLNIIYMGEQCKGVGAAAQVYFGKELGELTIAECASLIGITNNPSLYDPYISIKTRERNKTRQETILYQMYWQGYITWQEYYDAKGQELNFTRMSREEAELLDPDGKPHYYSWFTDALIEDVIVDLMEAKDLPRDAASALLYTAGYQIYTTLDTELQAKVDQIYTDAENLPKGPSKTQSMDSVIVIMDPYTGDVPALAGGIGQKVGNRMWLGATKQLRQPGSSIKPISVYAYAMDLGYIRPWTLVNDSATGELPSRRDDWWPKNSGRNYRGLVTINTAVQNSINTVAVQVLEMMTTQASYDFMVNKLHVSTLVKSYNGHTDIDHSPLGLGGLTDGVSVREMAAAYSIFPNKGIYTEARLYTRILDSDGNVVIENIPESNVAVSEVTSYYMTEALKNVVRSGTGTSAALKGVKGIPVAGKTGTSSGSADRWFTGFTPYYVASIWSGYKTPESMSESINPSSGMFSKVMSLIHEDLEPREFYRPENMRSVTICEDSGLLATDACHDDVRGDHTMTLLVHQSQVPSRLCEAHVWETYCQLTEDTVLEDGTVVEAGRITGLAGPYCPEETLIRRSMLDPSKSTYKVPTPDVGIPYLVGSATTCWVHTSPIVPTPDPVTEYPTADDDNGGGMFYRPSPSPVDPDPYFPTETAPPPLATEMPIF